MKHSLTALCLFALVMGGCKKTEETVGADTAPGQTTTTGEIAGTASPGDLNPVSAQAYVDDVTIGHEVGSDGTIPAGHTGDDFKAGDPIHVAMKVKDAPAGAAVKVVWMGPNETKIGEEQKDVPPGATSLTFTASNTRRWAKGDYRAEVWIGDERVNTQQFQIVDAPRSGK
ncbi:MAG TPA: hypothetical protein VNL91_00315 [Thermoanaerobaculia bacterium]|nr:hypothetical protein [Thermoanaerobaculia bacterium]